MTQMPGGIKPPTQHCVLVIPSESDGSWCEREAFGRVFMEADLPNTRWICSPSAVCGKQPHLVAQTATLLVLECQLLPGLNVELLPAARNPPESLQLS